MVLRGANPVGRLALSASFGESGPVNPNVLDPSDRDPSSVASLKPGQALHLTREEPSLQNHSDREPFLDQPQHHRRRRVPSVL